jgi:hypothetical protein
MLKHLRFIDRERGRGKIVALESKSKCPGSRTRHPVPRCSQGGQELTFHRRNDGSFAGYPPGAATAEETEQLKSKTTLEFAQDYVRDRRWSLVHLHEGKKKPVVREWQNLRITADELPSYFSNGNGVAVLTGVSSGLGDVDIDCREAFSLADIYIPHTNLVSGHKSNPRSHRFFHCPGIGKTEQFRDLNGEMLIELRGGPGSFTVLPPSIHEETGEPCIWHEYGKPAKADAADLLRRVRIVAAGSLLARHWPERGSRHKAALALSGMLARAAWELAEVAGFVAAVAKSANDEEWWQRKDDALTTFEKIEQSRPVTGRSRLEELLGDNVVARACAWLGLSERGGASLSLVRKPIQVNNLITDLTPLSALKLENSRYVIDRLIVNGGINAFSGVPGHLKSWWLLNLCEHIVNGRDFYGRKVIKKHVFYFVREGIARSFKDRCRKLGLLDHRLFHPWGIWEPKGEPPCLLDDRYLEWARKHRDSVFVFEPFASFVKDEHLNDDEIVRVTNRLMQIANTGNNTILGAYHATMGRSRKPFLGYTGIFAEPEAAYSLKAGGTTDAPTRSLTLELFKSRAEVDGHLEFVWTRATGRFTPISVDQGTAHSSGRRKSAESSRPFAKSDKHSADSVSGKGIDAAIAEVIRQHGEITKTKLEKEVMAAGFTQNAFRVRVKQRSEQWRRKMAGRKIVFTLR